MVAVVVVWVVIFAWALEALGALVALLVADGEVLGESIPFGG